MKQQKHELAYFGTIENGFETFIRIELYRLSGDHDHIANVLYIWKDYLDSLNIITSNVNKQEIVFKLSDLLINYEKEHLITDKNLLEDAHYFLTGINQFDLEVNRYVAILKIKLQEIIDKIQNGHRFLSNAELAENGSNAAKKLAQRQQINREQHPNNQPPSEENELPLRPILYGGFAFFAEFIMLALLISYLIARYIPSSRDSIILPSYISGLLTAMINSVCIILDLPFPHQYVLDVIQEFIVITEISPIPMIQEHQQPLQIVIEGNNNNNNNEYESPSRRYTQ